VQIGIRRSALDLVFSDEEAKRKATAQQALAPQPAPALAAFVTSGGPGGIRRSFPARADLCPKAEAGVRPSESVTVAIGRPPKPGTYTFHNTGTFKLEGVVPLQGRYPPFSVKTVRVLAPASDGERFRTEIVQRGAGDDATTITYAIRADALQLARLHVKVRDDEVTFEPESPVTLMALGTGEGETWRSAGVDADTGTSMIVEGRIEKRESVDVCGKVYDTYRVSSDETIVNVFTGFRHETNDPTIYNVATHLGGLFLREDVDTTTTIPTQRGPVIVHLDYVSTMNSVEPGPPA
jgi:hypothetical protein